MRSEVATRDSWKTIPMSASRLPVPFELRMTADEFDRVKRGNIPQEMEDKWFIFHEDGWVYFHRSWTGFCIYQVRFEQIDDAVVAKESWVTRDLGQYRNTDLDEDRQQLQILFFYRFGIGTEPSEEE